MNYKEVISKLQKYFLKQDRKTLARLCAIFAADLDKFINIADLSKQERDIFLERVYLNKKEISRFIKGDGEAEFQFDCVQSESEA